jgi:hypothetical protein
MVEIGVINLIQGED